MVLGDMGMLQVIMGIVIKEIVTGNVLPRHEDVMYVSVFLVPVFF